MKIRKHNCSYLKFKRYYTHKKPKAKSNKKIDCSHSKCQDCELWQHSPSCAERLILAPIVLTKNHTGDSTND